MAILLSKIPQYMIGVEEFKIPTLARSLLNSKSNELNII